MTTRRDAGRRLLNEDGGGRTAPESDWQNGAVLHSDRSVVTEIGVWTTIGHGAVVRSARIGDRVMIGTNATVMTGATIGDGSIVGSVRP
jgi:carbonic anhydrase/acetyltransferase-like protein (isoleucine patch superfamily)